MGGLNRDPPRRSATASGTGGVTGSGSPGFTSRRQLGRLLRDFLRWLLRCFLRRLFCLLRTHELRGLLEEVTQFGMADLREPHEDGSVTSIVRSHVIGVCLLLDQGVTRGKVDADHQRVGLGGGIDRSTGDQLALQLEGYAPGVGPSLDSRQLGRR
jgi:hypothetical protein